MLPFVVAMIRPNHIVMRPFGLVKSPSKDAAAKVGMLSVLPHTYSVSPSSVVHCVHSLCFIVRATCTINLLNGGIDWIHKTRPNLNFLCMFESVLTGFKPNKTKMINLYKYSNDLTPNNYQKN